jgi:hypothetical protein
MVLALAYLLGARGDALLSAGFLFNVCCYLAWLQLFWCVARRLVPGQAVLAATLVLLNGNLALVAMGQSDMGLFMALSWGLLTALLCGCFRGASVLLALCVLARPEGLVLATGLAVLAGVLALRRARQARPLACVAGVGVLAMAAVLTLNLLLTGMWQYQSVVGKGYLACYPLLGALGCTANDAGVLLREVLFNAGGSPRQNYFIPVFGGCLAIIGIAGVFRATTVRSGLRNALLVWWLSCSLCTLGVVAQSEFQGLGNDRYLGWILPAWYLLAAAGVGQLVRLFACPRAGLTLGIVLVGYSVATWPFFLSRYAAQTAQMQALVSFGQSTHAGVPSGVPFGMLEGTGLRYYFGDRPVQHLNGIMSSTFRAQRDLVCSMETLRHEPKTRFDYWLVSPGLQGWCDATGLLGPLRMTDVDAPPGDYAFSLFQASWASMPDAALLPLDATVTKAVASLQLVDRLDVGYGPDERRCRYRVGSRLADVRILPFVSCRQIGAMRLTEVGQPVLGWDEFRIRAPQRLRPIRLIMRMTMDATSIVVRTNTRHLGERLHLRSPLRLNLLVNGMTLPEQKILVPDEADAFIECCLEIPAEYVTTDPLDVVVAGDHIAMGYWVYQ